MTLSSGVIHHWTFNNTTDGLDDTVGSWDMNNASFDSFPAGKFGNCALVGDSQGYRYGDNNTNNLEHSGVAGTIACWVNVSSDTGNSVAYPFATSNPATHRHSLRFTSGRIVKYYFNSQPRITGPAISAGDWHNLVWSITDDTANLYVDSVHAGSVSGTGIFEQFVVREWYTGKTNGGTGDYHLDDMTIWDRELTAVEVSGLWNGGTGLAGPSFEPTSPTLLYYHHYRKQALR